MLKMYLTGSS